MPTTAEGPIYGGLLKRPDELLDLARDRRAEYLKAAPWPHLVLEGLMDPALIAAAESQEIGPALELEPHRSYKNVKAESSDVTGSSAKSLLDEMNSASFVEFLQELTGIPSLIADPTHFYAGIHVSPPGAFQSVHQDFRTHNVSKLFHRVNVLLYLNSDWEVEYGGALELWPSSMKAYGQRILPTAGRMVIFETTPESLHGVPDPVSCPPGRARLSLASYYYSESPGPQAQRAPLIRRPRRPQDPWFKGFAAPSDAFNTLRLARRLFG